MAVELMKYRLAGPPLIYLIGKGRIVNPIAKAVIPMAVAIAILAAPVLASASGPHRSSGNTRSSESGVKRSGSHSGTSRARPGDHVVHGYMKRNGAVVAPYHATNPDHTKNNNYSTRGNVNPYTGKEGTKPRD